MIKIAKPLFPLLAALALAACQPAINAPDTKATFGIHAVLHATDGSPATILPNGYVLGENVERMTDRNGEALFVVQPATIGTDCLQSIRAAEAEYGGPVLNFTLTPDCAETLGRMTARSVNKRMAVVINDEVMSAPAIRAPITAGSGFIEGGFESLEEAKAIARQFD